MLRVSPIFITSKASTGRPACARRRASTLGGSSSGSSVSPSKVPQCMFVNNILVKSGLKPTDISVVGVGTGAGAFAAMEKGELDALSNLDPVITQLESTGKFVAVADSRTEKGMKDIYGGDYHASVIYITEEFIKKNPNTVQAVVNAMVRADKWIAKATPQEIVDLVPNEYKAGNPSLYKDALLKNMSIPSTVYGLRRWCG